MATEQDSSEFQNLIVPASEVLPDKYQVKVEWVLQGLGAIGG